MEKSPARKNDVLANALQLKSEKAKDPIEAFKFLSQALCFSTDETRDQVVRKRSKKWEELKNTKNALTDLLFVNNKDEQDKSRIIELAKSSDVLKEHSKESDIEQTLEDIEKSINNVESKANVKSFPRHTTLKEFSSQIDIKNEEGRGRFLVAAQDIEPGEVIAVDTSHASLLGTN